MTETVKLGELEVNLDDLSVFLMEANTNGYAGSISQTRMPDKSKVYTFSNGVFHYTDTYSGSCQAPGYEVVRDKDQNGQWIWFMSYSGGMFPEFWENRELTEETYAFLKQSLLRMPLGAPFRGPRFFELGDFTYSFKFEGDIERLKGYEEIKQRKNGFSKAVFTQDIIGGLAVPKIAK